MTRTLRSLALALPLALTASMALSSVGHAQTTPPAAVTDAREMVPSALLGVWKADVAASTYASTPPREQLRIFQYTEDAKLLVMFLNQSANGGQSGGHWAVQVDGTPGIEYHSNHGSTPYNVVTLTKADARTFDLTVARGGEVNLTGRYTLSEDGSTLAYTYGATRILYRRWGV